MKNNLKKSEGRLLTYAYGFPRLGKNREYKKLIENFWSKKIKEEELRQGIFELEEERLKTYQKYVDKFPVGEMTFYDNVLDTAIMLGLYKIENLEQYFSLCRGKEALELTKWFNTNYHYLVPRLPAGFKNQDFRLVWNKPKEEFLLHKKGTPYLIGPFTFLKLSKGIKGKNFERYLLSLAEIYSEIIKDFREVHIDEPAFVTDVSEGEVNLIKDVYRKITAANPNVNLFTYYDSVDFLNDLYELPLKAIGLDFVHGKENLTNIRKQGFPEHMTLVCGLIDGRNVWKTDLEKALALLEELSKGAKNLAISNAAPLYHLPLTTEGENLDPRLLERISFAKERLAEIDLLATIYYEREKPLLKKEKSVIEIFGLNEKVKDRVKNLKDNDFKRPLSYEKRTKIQKKILSLPLFPTTTIGSYPQTENIRKKRREFYSGKISGKDYQEFIKEKIKELIKFQEELGLDVLVHGEFERTDMVEFFAQKLDGFVTTKNGWILSYGTRVYRPPLIYGDISRPAPLTINEIGFAQSLTKKPVKGMLTGPVTMIAWSFVREDIPVSEVAYQIALCLQDEIKDYEREGIKIVQIDEPAFREKAPLKKRNWQEYFDWAIKAFNLAVSGAKPETQIQTHMCYSDFGEIIKYILELDFDVLLIEATRSRGAILNAFKDSSFRKQIGPGVWDIHSPAVPTVKDMRKIIDVALKFIPKENLWLNPDCGLKTRGWKETELALKNLVELAKNLRDKEKSIK